MDIISFIIFLAIGALVGWLSGVLVRGSGFGVAGNVAVGIVGAVLGGYIFDMLGIRTEGLLGAIVMATLGAVALLYLIRLLKRV